jgi:hypothetical protein
MRPLGIPERPGADRGDSDPDERHFAGLVLATARSPHACVAEVENRSELAEVILLLLEVGHLGRVVDRVELAEAVGDRLPASAAPLARGDVSISGVDLGQMLPDGRCGRSRVDSASCRF